MLESWKPIAGFENLYEISNFGRVKRLAHSIMRSNGVVQTFKERILKPGKMNSGYLFVILRKNNHNFKYSIHRIVAQAFITNPNNLPDVNHIDGNKLNDNVENLEWCTRSENLAHALKIGLIENQCKICRKVIIKRDEKIITFDTMKDCAEFFGFKKGWLHNKIRKHGLTFIYDGYEINVSERRRFDRNVKFL